MYPKLFHIYGPIEINGFNAALLVGIGLFFYAALRHPGLNKHISTTDFLNISIETGIAAVIGGRILHIISQWKEYDSVLQMLMIWNGGMSILGALAAGFIYALWSLKSKRLPMLTLFDIGALYAPLIHGIARIGCFLVGCCHGCQTAVPWGITYTNELVHAPLNVSLHPTQLYSSLLYFGIFIFLYFLATRRSAQAGTITLLYLMATSFERWFIDFFRGDRIMTAAPYPYNYFSFHQWIALGIFLAAGTTLYYLHTYKRRIHESV